METAEKLTEEYQRAEAERHQRDPKAQTWGLALLYPAAALIIAVGLSKPNPEVCLTAQGLLTIIGGVWISWVSARLLARESHRYRVWVQWLFGILVFVGCVVVLIGGEHLPRTPDF